MCLHVPTEVPRPCAEATLNSKCAARLGPRPTLLGPSPFISRLHGQRNPRPRSLKSCNPQGRGGYPIILPSPLGPPMPFRSPEWRPKAAPGPWAGGAEGQPQGQERNGLLRLPESPIHVDNETYVCECVYIYIYTSIYPSMHAHIYIYMYAYMCTQRYIYIYMYIHIHTPLD